MPSFFNSDLVAISYSISVAVLGIVTREVVSAVIVAWYSTLDAEAVSWTHWQSLKSGLHKRPGSKS